MHQKGTEKTCPTGSGGVHGTHSEWRQRTRSSSRRIHTSVAAFHTLYQQRRSRQPSTILRRTDTTTKQYCLRYALTGMDWNEGSQKRPARMVRGRTCIRCVAAIAVRVTQLQQSELVIGPGTFAKKKTYSLTPLCASLCRLCTHTCSGVCARDLIRKLSYLCCIRLRI